MDVYPQPRSIKKLLLPPLLKLRENEESDEHPSKIRVSSGQIDSPTDGRTDTPISTPNNLKLIWSKVT